MLGDNFPNEERPRKSAFETSFYLLFKAIPHKQIYLGSRLLFKHVLLNKTYLNVHIHT